MPLRCHKCGHVWEEDPNSSQPAALCPECFELIPLNLARQNFEHASTMIEGNDALGGGGSASGGGTHDEETLITPQSGGSGARDRSAIQHVDSDHGLHEQETIPGRYAELKAAAEVDYDPADDDSAYGQETVPGGLGSSASIGGADDEDSVFESMDDDSSVPPTIDHNAPTMGASTPRRAATGGFHVSAPKGLHDQETMDGTIGRENRTPSSSSAAKKSKRGRGSSGRGAGGGGSAGRTDFGSASPKEIDLSGEQIGGYVVKRMLGAGGMGAVCLARQVSLDRDIALKILPGRLAQHPELLARFTREALSAAQLTHHNIVQVYDVGNADHIHYISMEFVRGENLGTMVKDEGRLTLEDAAGYILQAARGLKYAHDRGIIHRDIKPDNLMVNEHGIVKIADMGLAKMGEEIQKTKVASSVTTSSSPTVGAASFDSNLTMHDVAMGTPAYMAPEQAKDASSVDHRADIYSLGCTLYYLCTGSAPFSGSSVGEILSKHMSEQPPRLEGKLKVVPGALQNIIDIAMAKDPDERYASMAEVIKDLEAYLGVESEKGAYTPREHHMELLEREQTAYHSASGIKKRKIAVLAFFLGVPLLLAMFWMMGEKPFVKGMLGIFVLTPIANVIFEGLKRKTFLFRRLRSVFFGMSLKGYATTLLGTAATLAALWFTGLLVWWAVFAVLAIAAAYAYQRWIIGPLHDERDPHLDKVRDMMKQLRVRGVPEDQLQNFVYRFTGDHWEEFFEELFGYDEMLRARGRWAAADQVAPRKKFATWRDPIFRWLTKVEKARKAVREKKQLARVETERLKAEGVSAGEAAKRADLLATQVMGEVLADAAKADAKDMQIEFVRKGPRYTLGTLVYQLIRLVTGGALLALWANKQYVGMDVPFVGMLPFDASDLIEVLSGWVGLGFGVALVIQCISRRLIAPFLPLVGLVLVAAPGPIAEMIAQPQATEAVVFWAGCGLGALGVAFSAMMKAFGEDW